MTQPFNVGDRIVDLAYPYHGSLIVETITLTDYGHWRLTAHGTGPRSGCWTNAPASHFIHVPPQWREPPLPPTTKLHSVLSQVHEPITQAEIREVGLLEETPASRHERATASLKMTKWWIEVWSEIDKSRTVEQVYGLISLATHLIEQDSQF